MGAIADLWKSERGLLAILIILAATTLTALDRMGISDWQTFVTGIFITYAAGKTITSGISIAKGVTDTNPPVTVPPAPIPGPDPVLDASAKTETPE